MKIPVVITTIYPPSKSIQQFSGMKEYVLYVSGDNKTPERWLNRNTHFFSIEDQKKQFPDLHKLVAENHYSRKNFAYLFAIRFTDSDRMFESDDDNIPNSHFPNDTKESFTEIDTLYLKDKKCKVFNVFNLFTKSKVWPRGFPLSDLHLKPNYNLQKKTTKILLEHSLSDLDPDVDAVYRLTNGQEVNFLQNKKISLARNIYCPFNSQSTYWRKEIFPLLYLPSTVTSRVCDIWRGYVAQRIIWELGGNIVFLSPCVYQERNRHDFMKDFNEELDLYLRVNNLIELLDSLTLKGSVNNMLYSTYEHLVKNGFFQTQELKILEMWLSNF